MFTDTERLDFLTNLGTAEISKKFSNRRGSHWPWTISMAGMKKGDEFDDFRDAVDDAMRREGYISKSKKNL